MDINKQGGEAFVSIAPLLEKEAASYKTAAIIFAVLGLALFFVFYIAGIIFLLVALLMMYFSIRNRKGFIWIISSRITDKRIRTKIFRDEDSDENSELHHYIFGIRPETAFKIDSAGAEKVAIPIFNLKQILVPDDVYPLFNENDEFNFILTPARDLIGYYRNNELVVLSSGFTIKDHYTGV